MEDNSTFACLGIDALINASTNFMHNLLPKWNSLRILDNVYIYTMMNLCRGNQVLMSLAMRAIAK